MLDVCINLFIIQKPLATATAAAAATAVAA
jgi:hypothetical protein